MDYLTYVTTHKECGVLGSKEGVFHVKLEEIGVTKQKRKERVLIQRHALLNVASPSGAPEPYWSFVNRRGKGFLCWKPEEVGSAQHVTLRDINNIKKPNAI